MQKDATVVWQNIFRQNIRSTQQLIALLDLSPEQQSCIIDNPLFQLNIPLRIAKKMAKATIEDPIFRQFVPLKAEEQDSIGYVLDPVDDLCSRKTEKLLHKYHGRALIVTNGTCAMHCRYCFRQNFPYEEVQGFTEPLDYIRNTPSIEEVILSGGDPLSMSNKSLKLLLREIEGIPHVERIRFHSRFCMGIPERVDEEFLELLEKRTKPIWFALHANHPDEFDQDIWDSLSKIQKIGIPVLHHAVLLQGVNDDIITLEKLYKGLINHGIFPYYLYQLDQVKGTHHFFVAKEVGAQLIHELTRRLPGFGVPKYVQEIPGKASKTALFKELHLLQGLDTEKV